MERKQLVNYLKFSEELTARLKTGYNRAKELKLKKEFIRGYELIDHWLYNQIDPYTCFYCEKSLGKTWELDHALAVSRGGSHIKCNLVPACMPCNRRKHVTPWYEFMDSERLKARQAILAEIRARNNPKPAEPSDGRYWGASRDLENESGIFTLKQTFRVMAR